MANTGGDFDYKQFRGDWDNLLDRQKYKEAEKLCHEGLAKSPLDQSRGRLYNHLGYLYENFLDDKTFDDILEHYVLSLQVDESNANSHYNLANFLLEQGMQHLLRALELNPNHGKANKRYANLTPIKANTTLDLGGHKYQVVEVVEDGVRAVRLRKRNDGGYERSDDEPVYVEVGSPEKVYPNSNQTNSSQKGRAGNVNNGPIPLNIEDPNGAQYSSLNNGRRDSNQGCCYKCVLYWWFWCLLWVIALGGVVVPCLAYLQIFGTDECIDKVTVDMIALNSDADTQGSVNVLFVMNCDSNDWEGQFASADTFMTQLTNGNKVKAMYDIMQYCNNEQNEGVYSNDSLNNGQFTEYSSNIQSTDLTQESAVDGSNNYIAGALEACRDVYDEMYTDTNDMTPFLCAPFVSFEFIDTFEAMNIASEDMFNGIYLLFMTDETDDAYSVNIYSVLGSFAVSQECINKIDSEYAYGNTWWDTQLNCNSNTQAQSQCTHCINYASNSANLECAVTEVQSIFTGEGITEMKVSTDDGEQVCTHKYETIFFYCIGGVVPLLLWVFIVILVLCCRQCRSGNKSSMEQSIANDNKQTAFV